MIIAISGKINHGKDRVADCIQYLTSFASKLRIPLETYRKSKFLKFIFPSKFENKKFAAKLKYISHILLGLPLEDMYSHEGKNKWLADWGMTVRDFQIRLGTPGMRGGVHEDGWIITLFADLNPYKQSNWAISDMRFKNEFREVKRRNGITIRVNRPEITDNLDHISETDLDDIQDWNYHICNNGTLHDLLKKVKLMLTDINNGIKKGLY